MITSRSLLVITRGGTRLPSECDYLPKYSSLWRLSIDNRHKREHSAVGCGAKCHLMWSPSCGSSLTYMQANYAMPSYFQYLVGLSQCLKRRVLYWVLYLGKYFALWLTSLSHNYQVEREKKKTSNDIFQYEPSSNFIKKSTSLVDKNLLSLNEFRW